MARISHELREIQRTGWRLLAASVILLGVCAGASAQQAEPTVTVEVGFDGYCRQGAWCPVRVLLANDGADIEGDVVVTPPGENWDVTDAYQARVVLPSRSRKAVVVYVPTRFAGRTLSMMVQLLVDGRVAVQQSASVRLLPADEYLYAVVASNPSAFNLLGGLAPVGASATVAHVSLDALPPHALGWESLDVLILNDVDTTALDAVRMEALTTWIAHGGRLVVGGGPGAARTAAGLGDLPPAQPGALHTVAGLDALGAYANAVVLPGPYAIVESMVLRGETVVEQDGVSLVAARSLGAGRALSLAYDAGVAPFSAWEESIRLWELLLDLDAPGLVHLGIRSEHSAGQAVAVIPGLRPPSALNIAIFLLVYTALIGPVNYLFLRRLNRRELAWLTIPLLVLVFTAIAYLTGFQVRGRTPIVHRVASVYVPAGADVGRVTQLVGVFSPRRARYDVVTGAMAARRIGGRYAPARDTAALTIANDADGWTVRGLQVDIGGLRSFVVEGYAPVTPPQSTLRMQRNEHNKLVITGAVMNGSIALQDAVLIVGSNEYALGDLEPGQAISDLGEPASSGLLRVSPYWMIDPQVDAIQLRRIYFVSALAEEHRFPLSGSIYLVGWSDAAPLDVALAGRYSISSDLALMVFELSVGAPDEPGPVYIPRSFTPWEIESSSGYVDLSRWIEIYSGGWVVFRFPTLSSAALDRVDRLVLTIVRNEYRVETLPVAELWNWQDGRWDRHDIGWGDTVIPNPHLYVDSGGVIRLRLEARGGQGVLIGDLGFSIEGRRE